MPPTSDVVAALTEEVQRLKGIVASDETASVSGLSSASKSSKHASSSLVINGKSKSLGGVWMSAADEARVDRLLENLEAECDDESVLHAWENGEVADGEGYKPPAEEAARLGVIDAALDEFLAMDDGDDEGAPALLRPRMPMADPLSDASSLMSKSYVTAPPQPHDDFLSDLKRERHVAEVETRVADGLNRLNAISSNAPAADGDEQRMLAELLSQLRSQAERKVDEYAHASRPGTAGSRPGTAGSIS